MRAARILVIALALTSLAACGAGVPTPTPLSGLVISGHVTDAATGAPVANACITLGPPSVCFTKTNGEGRYAIDLGALAASPGGQWDLHALREPDYAQAYSGVFTVSGPVVRDFKLTRK